MWAHAYNFVQIMRAMDLKILLWQTPPLLMYLRPLVQIKVTQAFMNAAKLVEPSLPDQIVMECSA